jgi:hypothetical protein
LDDYLPTLEATLFEQLGDRPPANEGNLPTPMFHVEHPSTTNVKRLGGADPIRGPSHVPRGTSSSPVTYRNEPEPRVKIFHGVALPHRNPGVAPGGNVPRGTLTSLASDSSGSVSCYPWSLRGGGPPPLSQSCAAWQCSTWNTHLRPNWKGVGQVPPLGHVPRGTLQSPPPGHLKALFWAPWPQNWRGSS